MLSLIAMVGDAKALSHLHDALDGYANVTCVRDAADLARHAARGAPDIIVLGINDAAQPPVRLTVRETIEQCPATRLVVMCRLDADDMRALTHLRYLDVWDLVVTHCESPAMTRRRLLTAAPGRLADMRVRRMVCPFAPAWIRPLVDWCTEHDGSARPDVRSMAKIGNMRRETLARLCRARGVCPPNHVISWILALRATARMDTSHNSLGTIARDLGLASAGSLANLFVRRTRQTPSRVRALGLAYIADRAVREMFGQTLDTISLPRGPTGRGREHFAR